MDKIEFDTEMNLETIQKDEARTVSKLNNIQYNGAITVNKGTVNTSLY